ncbi:hypothetical protein B0T10DRAFT_136942 [Thelonectria olida]|uniref:Uncharacterized protein n=1 Tax=Thelonectria olida TaxID=1576542 RepID=A0A9P8VXW2_9HYPO|nr:hypothetical protein B0T10DRAFT_136942 [Thelonectria olida]
MLAGVIDRVRSSVGPSNASSERATKRPRLDRQVSDPIVTREIDPLTFETELTGLMEKAGNEDINLNETPDVGPRNVVMQFTRAEVKRLEELFRGSPFLPAIKASRQWRWERAREATSSQSEARTDCMIALVPGSEMQDFSFAVRVGYEAGMKIAERLFYGQSTPFFPHH